MKALMTYEAITHLDIEVLTTIMTMAFNEDTIMHTDNLEDGPPGYDDGSLIRRLLDQNNYDNCKILMDNVIVGAFTIAKNTEDSHCLEMLYIDPAYHGQNIGSEVWKFIEEKYIHVNVWRVETPDYSIRNHYFYTKKCGFVYFGENHYPDGARSFVFEKVKK